jgi:hypothetical protein
MRTPARLPSADRAVIEERKIARYLLARDHPAGRAKAALFERFGFEIANWQVLREALLAHARTSRIVSLSDTEFGTKYILEGLLRTPDRRRLRLRAVWFVESGDVSPRLVTAYAASGAGR